MWAMMFIHWKVCLPTNGLSQNRASAPPILFDHNAFLEAMSKKQIEDYDPIVLILRAKYAVVVTSYGLRSKLVGNTSVYRACCNAILYQLHQCSQCSLHL